MIYNVSGFPYSDELYHFGIPGMKWYVRRYQNSDGTLTAAGKERYSSKKTLGERINDAVGKSREKKREEYVKSRPWLMTDDELRNKLNRINMEKQYLNSLKEVESFNGEKRTHKLLSEIGDKAVRSISDKVIWAIGEKYANSERIKNEKAYQKAMTKRRIKDESKYNRTMAKETAMTKVKMDKYLDKQMRKLEKGDYSKKMYKDIRKNIDSLSSDDVALFDKKYKLIKDMEKHYGGVSIGALNIPSFSGGKKKG